MGGSFAAAAALAAAFFVVLLGLHAPGFYAMPCTQNQERLLKCVAQHMHDEQRSVGCQQFLERNIPARGQGLTVLQQPARALDHPPGRLVFPLLIDAVHAYPIDHLAAVLGREVNQVKDNDSSDRRWLAAVLTGLSRLEVPAVGASTGATEEQHEMAGRAAVPFI